MYSWKWYSWNMWIIVIYYNWIPIRYLESSYYYLIQSNNSAPSKISILYIWILSKHYLNKHIILFCDIKCYQVSSCKYTKLYNVHTIFHRAIQNSLHSANLINNVIMLASVDFIYQSVPIQHFTPDFDLMIRCIDCWISHMF